MQRLEVSRHAVRLFGSVGVSATSGEDVAAAAGLSVRTLWRWFRTKEGFVEPLLSASAEAFAETVRTWPAGRPLADHLETSYRLPLPSGPDDLAAVLEVVRLSREEPGLRAVWLLVAQRAEAPLAAAIAARTGRDADELEVRVQAASITAALRISTEESAAAGTAHRPVTIDAHRARLATVLRVATGGLAGAGVSDRDD